MQHFEAVPVEEVSLESPTGQLGSPMIVPPSEEVVAAASSLLGWQAQQGFMSADEATSALRSGPRGANDAPACSAARASSSRYSLGCGNAATGAMARKVLSYDPAIGRNGAFYFVDVDSPPDSDVVPAGRSAVVPPVRDQNSAGSGVGHAPGQGGMCTPGSAAASGTQEVRRGGTGQHTAATIGSARARPSAILACTGYGG
ncbi:hypothetical protein HXX76_012821 [Chlamydomonas incerta]|uniref:Uncharacterized protein n=1 Tax=Chlamydomonas incerta TaxID=51695 RepID=A0A835VV84_CHLIN|nr:hypothetical protein HXX76_012821 [Chlamydomonas incerta]|eukprot:KAG2426764.1 hypothetical protein HXX76_012821 [Chlamydomonas incerta]